MVHIAQDKFKNKELAPVHRLGRGTTGSVIFTKVRVKTQWIRLICLLSITIQ